MIKHLFDLFLRYSDDLGTDRKVGFFSVCISDAFACIAKLHGLAFADRVEAGRDKFARDPRPS